MLYNVLLTLERASSQVGESSYGEPVYHPRMVLYCKLNEELVAKRSPRFPNSFSRNKADGTKNSSTHADWKHSAAAKKPSTKSHKGTYSLRTWIERELLLCQLPNNRQLRL